MSLLENADQQQNPKHFYFFGVRLKVHTTEKMAFQRNTKDYKILNDGFAINLVEKYGPYK